MMLSDVCLSRTPIGPKSRTERPRKTKIGTEVAHVTSDSDTTFKVKRSKVKVTGAGTYCGGLRPTACFMFFPCYAPSQGALSDDAVRRLSRTSGRQAACTAGRLDGAYWLIGPGSAGPGRPAWLKAAAARLRCRPGRGHIVAAARLQFVLSLVVLV